jgi:Xaa-Pro aminopeptidase
MYEQRLAAVRRSLESSKLDALLVTHLPHVRYLTGFSGSNGLCIISSRHQYFLTDSRYRDQAREEVTTCPVLVSKDSLHEAILKARLLAARMRVGFEGQYVSVDSSLSLRKTFPRVTFVSTRSLIERFASVKDESEIACIRRAAEITDKVFRKIVALLQPGMREQDVAAEIGYYHRKYGAEGDAFEPIVASGLRGAFPHARASTKKIRRGELVTLDFGCRVGGYHSDLTRTVAIGRPNPRAERLYKVVLDAQMKAVEAARSGVTARSLDSVARTHIRKRGFGRFFRHSLGHGLGLQVHEAPRISSMSKEILRSGNVVTIEPGIYVPGFGGVRIEDDVVIRDGGCEVLNKSPKELLVV